MHLKLHRDVKERIVSGDMDALKIVLMDARIRNIESLTEHIGESSIHQGVGQLLTELLDVFNLKVCLSDD